MFKIEKQLVEAFRSGDGFAWSQQDTDMFDGAGTDRGSRFQSFRRVAETAFNAVYESRR